ncbi:GIDE domain-containing protein [Natrialba sp. INN-245]|uniref:GIDE domain-containing protein n=1 Tax=Natrialba sp. INN-245 TaxID=2690967 RepID=UPI00130FF703|nr:GIDE domain-containing protein [Natrialba sp. INN-245]MWV38360.1 hypothetical protein [Natrialba sp. INN-245]
MSGVVPPTGTLVIYAFVTAFLLVFVGIPLLVCLYYVRVGNELRIVSRRTRVGPGAGFAACILVVAVFAPLRVLGPFPDSVWFWLAAASFVAGVGLLTIAASNADWYRALGIESDRAGFVHDGPVRVTGDVRPVDDALVGPFSDEPCLAYAVSVQERRWIPNSRGSNTTMVPMAVDADATQFYVDDGSGELLVDPEAADVLPADPADVFARDVTIEVEDDECPPDHVVERFDDLEIGPTSRERSYREAHIQPGDEVTVVGHCESVGHGYASNRVVADAGESPTFVVATGSLEDVRSSVDMLVRWNAIAGSGLAGVGLFAMVWLVP